MYMSQLSLSHNVSIVGKGNNNEVAGLCVPFVEEQKLD